jgi:hypothetical protein
VTRLATCGAVTAPSLPDPAPTQTATRATFDLPKCIEDIVEHGFWLGRTMP